MAKFISYSQVLGQNQAKEPQDLVESRASWAQWPEQVTAGA